MTMRLLRPPVSWRAAPFRIAGWLIPMVVTACAAPGTAIAPGKPAAGTPGMDAPSFVSGEMDVARTAVADETVPAALPWIDPASNVFFDFGSSELDESARATIQPIAATLKSDRIRSVILVGHTNDQNSTEYALALAALRITAVEQEMLHLGVAKGQIHKRPVGRVKNVRNDCVTESCLRTTRRVEILFVAGSEH